MSKFRHLPTKTATMLMAMAAFSLPAVAEQTSLAQAELLDVDGNPVGIVEFSETSQGVLISAILTNLTPGEHGFHLHETGACSPDFSSAGGHFSPQGNGHGFLSDDGPHAGDLPNIFVSVEGEASAHFYNDRVTLMEGSASLLDEDGAAVIVHEFADTYGKQAGAGGRIACGIIQPLG